MQLLKSCSLGIAPEFEFGFKEAEVTKQELALAVRYLIVVIFVVVVFALLSYVTPKAALGWAAGALLGVASTMFLKEFDCSPWAETFYACFILVWLSFMCGLVFAGRDHADFTLLVAEGMAWFGGGFVTYGIPVRFLIVAFPVPKPKPELNKKPDGAGAEVGPKNTATF